MSARFPYSRISSFLALTLFLFVPLQSGASASLTVKRLTPTASIATGFTALAVNSTHIALVGEGISIRERSTGLNLIVRESSSSTIYTDVITTSSSFIAVGISESSTMTSRELIEGTINPDSIPVVTQERKQVGATRLAFLEFSASGEIVDESYFESDKPLLPRSLHLFGEQLVVVGEMASEGGYQGFLITRPLKSPEFRITRFGQVSTSIFSAATPRILYGSSEESLLGTKRQGIRDGVILFLDKDGEAIRVVRSFASGTKRQWQDVSPAHLAVGSLLTGDKNEIAITDFDSQGKPAWTTRIPGRFAMVEGRMVALITSARIKALPSFSPKNSQALFLQFDKNGGIRSASSLPAISILDLSSDHALIEAKSGAIQLISFS